MQEETQEAKDKKLIDELEILDYENLVTNWSYIYRLLMNADLSGQHSNEYINCIFKAVIKLVRGFVALNYHDDYASCFELMNWSMIKFFTEKLYAKVSPVVQIRTIPYTYKDALFIEVKCGDRIKHYRFKYNKGMEELSIQDFNAMLEAHPIENTNELVRFIPLQMLEV